MVLSICLGVHLGLIVLNFRLGDSPFLASNHFLAVIAAQHILVIHGFWLLRSSAIPVRTATIPLYR
jgi:hypothetical protein